MTTISATKPSRRGGRPTLKKEAVRKPYGIRLSELERLHTRERAAELGLDWSTYCRNAILNATTPRPVPSINLQAWLQLAQLANTLTTLTRNHEGELISQLDELRDLLKSTRMSLLGIRNVLDGEQ